MIRLAGYGAAFLVFIAVGAGFQGERFTQMMANLLARLGPLAEPLFFGVSALELVAALAVVGLLGWTVWRGFRR